MPCTKLQLNISWTIEMSEHSPPLITYKNETKVYFLGRAEYAIDESSVIETKMTKIDGYVSPMHEFMLQLKLYPFSSDKPLEDQGSGNSQHSGMEYSAPESEFIVFVSVRAYSRPD